MLAYGLPGAMAVQHVPVQGQLGMRLKESSRGGWEVSDVVAGGCADVAGVRNHDRLVMIDELSLTEARLDLESIKELLSTPWVKLTLMRQGRQLQVMLQRPEIRNSLPRAGHRDPAEQGRLLARQQLQQQQARTVPYYAAGSSQQWQQQRLADPTVLGAHARYLHQLPIPQGSEHRPESGDGGGARPSSGGYGDAEILEAEMERVRLVESGREARAALEAPVPAPYQINTKAVRISVTAHLSPPDKTDLPPGGGLLGLINLGNTCFLNSIVQCLAHVAPFVEHVIFQLDDELQQLLKAVEQAALAAAGAAGGKQTGGIVAASAPGDRLRVVRALVALMRHLWSGEHQRPLEPRTLLAALKDDKRCSMLFNGRQQDAHECLVILLDIIHMDTNGMVQSDTAAAAPPPHTVVATPASPAADDGWSVVNKAEADKGVEDDWDIPAANDVVDMDSVVSKYMRGILRCETKCKACSYATHNKDKFFVATLPLPPRRQFPVITPISLEECFALSEKPEVISTWTCDKCRRLDATNTSIVTSHPRILILHLARFEYVTGSNTRRKRTDEILIPAKISRPGPPGDPPHRFELLAWSEHLGNDDSSGHYVAIARHIDGSFRRYDDDKVTVLPPLPQVMKSTAAYILFYERRS